MTIQKILSNVKNELKSAKLKFNDFNSYHEGYAVILEEMEEVWEEIKKKKPDRLKIEQECIQVAAMSVRMIIDLCYSENPTDEKTRPYKHGKEY